jgi:pyridoxal phosphate enzyme (YggS family)
MSTVSEKLFTLNQQIGATLIAANRPANSTTLLCVCKTRSEAEILQAIDAGQTLFAENQVQEALPKIEHFKDYSLEWHFIGQLQKNKTAKVAQHFSWVQSICDLKTVQRLNAQRPEHLPPLNICLQVNIDGDPDKAGLDPADIFDFAEAIVDLDKIQLRGLMPVLKKETSPEAQLQSFEKLHQCFIVLQEKFANIDTLSMGMSTSFIPAIQAGATLIRVGGAIFN